MSWSRAPLRRICRAAALIAGAVVSLGCSVTALAERERAIAVNRCESDDECSGGRCSGGLCVSNQGELRTLWFELMPTESGENLAGVSFLQSVSNLSPSGGALELTLDAVPIEGWISAVPRPGCAPTFLGSQLLPLAVDNTIPARVTFTPASRTLGLSLSSRTSETQPSYSGSGASLRIEKFHFGASLPAGAYDVRIEPFMLATQPPPEASCKYPPQLIRGLCIEGRARLALPLPLASHLKLSVTDRDQPLDDWIVDVIDPSTGMVISNRVALSLPSTSGAVSEYSVDLDYLPVIEHRDCEQLAAPSANELVRLTPPDGVIAPTILFDRTALQLFSTGVGRIDELPGLSKPVILEGHVFSVSTQAPEAATLTFVGRSLKGVPAGVLASFARTVQTESDGTFEVELLPGTYDVQAAPNAASDNSPRAATRVTWDVADSPARQGGRGIALSNAISVAGIAVVPSGDREGARGASVVAEASPAALSSNLLARALDGVQLVPRATSALITDSEGHFALSADAGLFDFSVRPPGESGFAWLVMPGLDLEQPLATRELPALELPLPVVFQLQAIGDTDIREAQLVGARVRAFVPLDAEGRPTSEISVASFLPVAEGRLDANGRVTMMVPASLHPPPAP